MSNRPYNQNFPIEEVKAKIAALLKAHDYWKALSIYQKHREELGQSDYNFDMICDDILFRQLKAMLEQSLELGLIGVYESFRVKWSKVNPHIFEVADASHAERIEYLRQKYAESKAMEIRLHLKQGAYGLATRLNTEYQSIPAIPPFNFESEADIHFFQPLASKLAQMDARDLANLEDIRMTWKSIRPSISDLAAERIRGIREALEQKRRFDVANSVAKQIRGCLEGLDYPGACKLHEANLELLSVIKYDLAAEVERHLAPKLAQILDCALKMLDIAGYESMERTLRHISPELFGVRTEALAMARAQLAARIERERIDGITQTIRSELAAGNFLQAQTIYMNNVADLTTARFDFPQVADELLFHPLSRKLDDALRTPKLDLYSDLASKWREYNAALFTLRDQQAEVLGLLQSFSFAAAEERQSRSQALAPDQYASQRRAMVMLWLRTSGLFTLNEEQLASIAAMGAGALLITARAGSGKTRVLVAAAKFISDRLGVDPAHIRLLAFNKKAQKLIQSRLETEFDLPGKDMASTFHALAYRTVRPPTNIEILVDKDESRTLTDFIRRIVDDLLENPKFQRQMYASFREEMVDQEQFGAGLSPSDRLIYLRNLTCVSLDGKAVKSKGEKWIADFLFEHDIKYSYEKPRIWNGSIYRPDFTIMRGEADWIILEHWALDPADFNATLPQDWDVTADEYRQQIYRKRGYWRGENQLLLETHSGLTRGDREDFEAHLLKLLREHGFIAKRLPDDEIARRLCKKQESRISRMFTQLIMRTRKVGWTAEMFRNKLAAYTPVEDRERIFLELGLEVLASYESKCRDKGCMDFDKLLELAEVKVLNEKGQTPLDRDGQVKVSDLKWILMDEFQDFAPQFNRLVQAIRTHAPHVRIVAVGDDWQAINAFAGSELSFFREFEKHFSPTARANLVDNHRSAPAILHAGNRLMAGHGAPANPAVQGTAHIEVFDVAKEWIEYRKGDDQPEQRNADAKYIFENVELEERFIDPDPGKIMTRYIKAIHTRLVEQGLLGKKVALLARTGKVHGLDESMLLGKLRSVLTTDEHRLVENFTDKFSFGTVHSYKGNEADVVFILETCRGRFPLLHPDEGFFRIFGNTLQDVLDEERRLFYVAITRAKTHLFLLTEGDRPSDYLFQAFPEESERAGIVRGGDAGRVDPTRERRYNFPRLPPGTSPV